MKMRHRRRFTPESIEAIVRDVESKHTPEELELFRRRWRFAFGMYKGLIANGAPKETANFMVKHWHGDGEKRAFEAFLDARGMNNLESLPEDKFTNKSEAKEFAKWVLSDEYGGFEEG